MSPGAAINPRPAVGRKNSKAELAPADPVADEGENGGDGNQHVQNGSDKRQSVQGPSLERSVLVDEPNHAISNSENANGTARTAATPRPRFVAAAS